MANTFGEFIREKRKVKQLTLRGFAKLSEISPVYVSNIEKGDRSAPSYEILLNMAQVLILDDLERENMFDLAAKSKNSIAIASDLVNYINGCEMAHTTLRKANRCNADDSDWEYFLEYLKNKY